MSNHRHLNPTRRWFCLASVPIGILAFAGCGQSASPSDPIEGRKLLVAALEAWKGGEKPDALANRSPSLHVSDGDWMSGFRLRGFKADNEGRLVGSDVNYDVVLELLDPKGKPVKREAVYAVTTHPQMLVLRQDSL